MPLFIHGWIEITGATPDAQGEDSWRGVVSLGNLLIDEGDSVAERLFGLSKGAIANPSTPFLAAGRGIPAYPSVEVQRDLSDIRALEHAASSHAFGGFTWATWQELTAVHFSPGDLAHSRWRIVFALARCLALESPVTPDQLRFTVWYSW